MLLCVIFVTSAVYSRRRSCLSLCGGRSAYSLCTWIYGSRGNGKEKQNLTSSAFRRNVATETISNLSARVLEGRGEKRFEMVFCASVCSKVKERKTTWSTERISCVKLICPTEKNAELQSRLFFLAELDLVKCEFINMRWEGAWKQLNYVYQVDMHEWWWSNGGDVETIRSEK